MELTIKACDVRPGDYLNITYENGKSGGSRGIGSIHVGATTTTLYGALAAYEYPNDQLLTVERY